LVSIFSIKLGIVFSGQLGYKTLVIPNVGTGYCLSVQNMMTRLLNRIHQNENKTLSISFVHLLM